MGPKIEREIKLILSSVQYFLAFISYDFNNKSFLPMIFANKFILLLASIVIASSINAQDSSDSSYSNDIFATNAIAFQSESNQSIHSGIERKWYYGGFLSFSFWNNGTDILIAPKAYYQFSPMFILGFGLTYIYSDGEYRQYYVDTPSQIFNYHSNSTGGSFAIIFRPFNFLQISAEYENLHTTWQGGGDFSRVYWDTGLFLGASYVAGNVAFGLRYNVLYDSSTSPYASALTPVVSFYF